MNEFHLFLSHVGTHFMLSNVIVMCLHREKAKAAAKPNPLAVMFAQAV
jgi:hypothetical protein